MRRGDANGDGFLESDTPGVCDGVPSCANEGWFHTPRDRAERLWDYDQHHNYQPGIDSLRCTISNCNISAGFNPFAWWLRNDEGVADAAATTGTAAGATELGFIACSGLIVTIPKCGTGAVVSAGIGTGASATELAAGVTSLDAYHIFWGTVGVVTLGLGGAVRTIDPDGVVALPRAAKDGLEIFVTEWVPKAFRWSTNQLSSMWD